MSENEIKNPKVGGVTAAEVPKEHLRLPQLHFIAAMDWIEKLGDTAFCAYLKLFTLADRKGKSLKSDEAKIKDSLANVQKELGVSKGTFYNKVIDPLWSYCLIDLETYEDSKMKKNAQKPVNIIVYPYPNMEFDRMVRPLEKLRDYKTDYNSEARIHARKKEKKVEADTVQNLDGIEIAAEQEDLDFNTVQNLDGGPSKNRTGARLKNEPNNLRSNSFKNGFNSFNNFEEEEEARALLHNPSLKNLYNVSVESGFSEEVAMELVTYVNEKKIANLKDEIILEAFAQVAADYESGKNILDAAKWTAGKIERVAKKPALNVEPKNLKPQKDSKKLKPQYGSDKSKYDFKKPVRSEKLPNWMVEREAAEAENKRLNEEMIGAVRPMDPEQLTAFESFVSSFQNDNMGKSYRLEFLTWIDDLFQKLGVKKYDFVSLKKAQMDDLMKKLGNFEKAGTA